MVTVTSATSPEIFGKTDIKIVQANLSEGETVDSRVSHCDECFKQNREEVESVALCYKCDLYVCSRCTQHHSNPTDHRLVHYEHCVSSKTESLEKFCDSLLKESPTERETKVLGETINISSIYCDSSRAFLRKIQTPQKLFMSRHHILGTESRNFVKKPFK